MAVERHLILQELTLRPAGEWTPDGSGWTIVRVAEGSGYWLQAGAARELNAGTLVISGPNVPAICRASQLGLLKLEFFTVQPQYLNGLLTVAEWSQLENLSHLSAPHTLVLCRREPTAQTFTRLAAQPARDGLSGRSALLQLWAAAITGLLPAPGQSVGGQQIARPPARCHRPDAGSRSWRNCR